MPAIDTAEWYESLKEILNSSDEVTKNAPRGQWHVLAEIKGDATSPYLAEGDIKRFGIVLTDGRGFFPDGRGDNFIRLPFSALTSGEIEEGIKRLAKAIDFYRK